MKTWLIMLSIFALGYSSDLKFTFTGDFGYIPHNRSVVYQSPLSYSYVASDNTFMMMFTPRLEYKFIYGELSVNTISKSPKNGKSFVPLRVVWGDEIGVYHTFNNLTISAGWEHNCGHRTVVTTFQQGERLVDNSYDNIFIRFKYSSD